MKTDFAGLVKGKKTVLRGKCYLSHPMGLNVNVLKFYVHIASLEVILR